MFVFGLLWFMQGPAVASKNAFNQGSDRVIAVQVPTRRLAGLFFVLNFISGWLLFISALSWGSEPRQWPIELEVGRFLIHADFDVSTATDLPPELTTLSTDVHELLGVGGGDRPVHVVLFATAKEYQRYMRNYFPQLPERRALFIQDRGPGMLFTHWHADVAIDLRHEITHALLNDSSPRPLPLWLDEGLAEYFEVERNRRFDGSDYLSDVCQRAVDGLVPSLKQLEEIDRLQDFKESQYRDSWAWVHFLLHRSTTTREALVRYLAEHRSGAEPLALSRQLSSASADISNEFLTHFKEFCRKLPNDLPRNGPSR